MLFPYEVTSYSPLPLPFTFEVSKRLLSMNDDGSLSNEPTSLLNFDNARVLARYSNPETKNYTKILEHFKLDSPLQAATLASYYIGTLKTYKKYSKIPKLDYYKSRFSRDSINDSIDLLQRYTLNNITMKAFSDIYKKNKNKFRCRDYFNVFGDTICNSNSLSLDSYQGIVTWVIAIQLDYSRGVDPAEWDARSFILKELGKESEEGFWEGVFENSLLNTTVWDIQLVFYKEFGCFYPPCSRKFIAERQYYEGKGIYSSLLGSYSVRHDHFEPSALRITQC